MTVNCSFRVQRCFSSDSNRFSWNDQFHMWLYPHHLSRFEEAKECLSQPNCLLCLFSDVWHPCVNLRVSHDLSDVFLKAFPPQLYLLCASYKQSMYPCNDATTWSYKDSWKSRAYAEPRYGWTESDPDNCWWKSDSQIHMQNDGNMHFGTSLLRLTPNENKTEEKWYAKFEQKIYIEQSCSRFQEDETNQWPEKGWNTTVEMSGISVSFSLSNHNLLNQQLLQNSVP